MNEEDFLNGKAFLDELTGGGMKDEDGLDYYVLETKEQEDAVAEFRRLLRERAAGPKM